MQTLPIGFLKAAEGGGGGYSPPSSIRAWYDADDASTITSDANGVSQWNDKSGNGFNVTQSNNTYKPKTGNNTLNGKNVLDFDQDYLYLTSQDLGIISDAVMFAVIRPSGSNTAVQGIMSYYKDANNNFSMLRISNTSFYCYAAFGSPKLTNTSYLSAGTANILTYTNDNLSLSNYKDGGTADDTGTAGGSIAASGQWCVGAYTAYFGQAWIGDIAELMYFDDMLTTTELNDVGNYLADKWGLSWTDIT